MDSFTSSPGSPRLRTDNSTRSRQVEKTKTNQPHHNNSHIPYRPPFGKETGTSPAPSLSLHKGHFLQGDMKAYTPQNSKVLCHDRALLSKQSRTPGTIPPRRTGSILQLPKGHTFLLIFYFLLKLLTFKHSFLGLKRLYNQQTLLASKAIEMVDCAVSDLRSNFSYRRKYEDN